MDVLPVRRFHCAGRVPHDYWQCVGRGSEALAGVTSMSAQQPPSKTTEQMVRALAIALRDKALADARQNMKVVRQLERDYGLTPADAKGRE